LPIGNLTSQFFSNVYLNRLDQFVKHKLKCKYYCRYVDDFILLDESPKQLNAWHKEIKEFLHETLHLELHDNKKSINKISKGVDFVGYVIKPYRMAIRQKTLKKAYKIINEYFKQGNRFDENKINGFICRINSYLGFLRGVNGYRLRRDICLRCVNLFIGCDEEYTKIFSVGRRNIKLNTAPCRQNRQI